MKLRIGSWFLLAAVCLASCKPGESPVMTKYMGETQGTYYAVTCYSADSINLQPAIDSLLKRFDSTASTYKPNSIISRINTNDPAVTTDDMFNTIFRKAMDVSEATGGVFDITVGNLVNAWGFGYTDRMKVDQHVVDSLLAITGYKNVALRDNQVVKKDPRISIDFNAIAQGYAVDVVSAFLESKGITAYLVDIGGEVVARGEKPGHEEWKVGIEKPAEHADDERKVQSVVKLRDMALSTSGNYRKFYEENGVRYSHTIDPATGYPVRHSLLSVSVLAPDCITADAYATSFMVMGVEKAKAYLESHHGLDAYFIFHENDSLKVYCTKGFESILEED